MSELDKKIKDILDREDSCDPMGKCHWQEDTIDQLKALFTSEWEQMGNELIGEDLSYIETEDKLGKYMQEDILVINKYKARLRQKLAKLMEGEKE